MLVPTVRRGNTVRVAPGLPFVINEAPGAGGQSGQARAIFPGRPRERMMMGGITSAGSLLTGIVDMTMMRPRRLMSAAGLALAGLVLAAASPPPVRNQTREFDDQGYHVKLDLTKQVVELMVPEESGGPAPPLFPRLSFGRGEFVSAAILAQKAKQFDDGLMAAVDLAAQYGAGPFAGKTAMLEAIARRLSTESVVTAQSPQAIVLAACRLGKLPVAIPRSALPAVESIEQAFLANPLRSQPIAFYTWTPALTNIFRQDRMLQVPLEGRAGIADVARALHADSRARATYDAYESLVARLTNPSNTADLRGLLTQLDRGALNAPEKGIAVFAPSRAHETDLVMKLYGNRPIPEGFNLADELVRRIQSGQVDLQPRAESGWYDHQTWALEPLVVPEGMPEATRVKASETYRKHLRDLFKGSLALARETHVKNLEMPAPGAAPPAANPKTVISVRPGLTVEPLATHYLRRGEAYRFVRTVLTVAFGADALRQMRRLTQAGPVATDLLAELEQMEALFLGASAAVNRQLGAAVAGGSDEAFERWRAVAANDPDLNGDVRMMVPVFYDRGRKLTKVWALLGWSERWLAVDFATPPSAEVFKGGEKATAGKFEVQFDGEGHRLFYPVVTEVYVSRVLDRDAFRKHCDLYKTPTTILKNLR